MKDLYKQYLDNEISYFKYLYEFLKQELKDAEWMNNKHYKKHLNEIYKKQKTFTLNTERAYKQAEIYKAELENHGYRVTTKTYGFNGVKITGVI